MEKKFRAWNGSEYIYFDFGNIYGYEGEVCGVVLPDEITMLNNNAGNNPGVNKEFEIDLFLGRQGKNGTDVYENDIIKDKVGRTWLVKFDKKKAAFAFFYARNRKQRILLDYFLPVHLPLEVIGNIREDPELLNR